jgi:hypothetical protein
MINASEYKPRIVPVLGDVDSAEIDRAQSIDPTVALNREKVEEIGREDVVGYLKKSPTIGYRLTQLEYGSIEFWEKLTNSNARGESGESPITLDEFKTPYFDICAYLTDDDGTFRGTYMYPALRVAGFGLTIGDPQARIERSFDFVGESAIIWQGVNKYVIYGKHTVETGEPESDDSVVIDLSVTGTPAPAVDPDNAGVYMIRVVRVRGLVSTVLTNTTDYQYANGGKTLTITTAVVGDIIKYCYTSVEAPVSATFTPNDADPSALLGDCASVYLYIPATGKPSASDYVYRLQSINFDVKFDREDLREIGNKDVVQRGIKNSTVTANLGRIVEQFTIEEILRGEATGYGKIDVEKLTDQVCLIVKVFTDNTKSTFAYGFKMEGMSPTDLKGGATVSEYIKADTTLTGESLEITADESELGI